MLLLFTAQAINTSVQAQENGKNRDEAYRPKIHFTPKAHWVNDPNGMVYHKGTYHLFYQYYPGSSVWGPMHWGHATSNNLISWKEQPIALYPDSLGYIFSGSAVVDKNNTSGLGKNVRLATSSKSKKVDKVQAPLVAIFTHHDPVGEKSGKNDFQNQSIAYSNDDGKTWTKYAGNPVIKNPGIIDFRDPKVMWYGPQKKWIMTLATKDHITFYSSPDLKSWNKESEFGKEAGAHGGVWECPDLFALDDSGKQCWVLMVSLNPGAPNSGSGTQYFVGNFDGKTFTSAQTATRWLDYGPDNYAGITWSNTGKRKIFIGWMSNWIYANLVPTETWRNAMTLPRELKIKRVANERYVTSQPVTELSAISSKPMSATHFTVNKKVDLATITSKVKLPCRINLNIDATKDYSLVLCNDTGDELIIGYDKKANRYFIDRSKAGRADFNKGFAALHTAPRISANTKMNLSLVIDVNSLELFADDGLTVMTSIFFPNKPYNKIYIQSPENIVIAKMEYINLTGK